jgi:hypothetical protein
VCLLARYTNLLLEVYVLAAKTPEAAAKLLASVAAMNESVRKRITLVKLGDEIGIGGGLNDTTFAQWCQHQVCLFVCLCLCVCFFVFFACFGCLHVCSYIQCSEIFQIRQVRSQVTNFETAIPLLSSSRVRE